MAEETQAISAFLPNYSSPHRDGSDTEFSIDFEKMATLHRHYFSGWGGLHCEFAEVRRGALSAGLAGRWLAPRVLVWVE